MNYKLDGMTFTVMLQCYIFDNVCYVDVNFYLMPQYYHLYTEKFQTQIPLQMKAQLILKHKFPSYNKPFKKVFWNI